MDNQTNVSLDLFTKKFADLCLKGGMSGMPKDELDQHILLKSMAITFETGVSYAEQEVNEKLAFWINKITNIQGLDHVSLRRRLVDAGYLLRSPDGSSYQVTATGPYQPTFDPAIAGVELAAVLQQRKAEIERRKQEYLTKAGSKK
jgi:hypothetical protein